MIHDDAYLDRHASRCKGRLCSGCVSMTFTELLARLDNVKGSGDKRTARCVAHQDSDNSLSISSGSDGRLLVKCFAGCDVNAICAALGIKVKDLFPSKEPKPGREKKEAAPSKPPTLADLAETKRLPVDWLRKQGLDDLPDGTGVAIAYYDENGNKHLRLRKRTALHAKEGSIWLGPKDVPLIAYGIWRLNDAREKARLVLVEGETDALTLWYHDVPALGIPGATMGHTLSSKCLVGIQQIFVYHEPDAGGRTFVSKLASRLRELEFAGEVHEFSIDGVKDPLELHIDDPDAFRKRFTQALERAIPLVEVKNTDRGREKAPQRDSQATQLVKFAHASGAQFFHYGEAGFASVRAEDHLETYALKSKGMRRWLTYLYFQSEGKAPNADAIRCAIDTLAAHAQFKSEERKAYVRCSPSAQVGQNGVIEEERILGSS